MSHTAESIRDSIRIRIVTPDSIRIRFERKRPIRRSLGYICKCFELVYRCWQRRRQRCSWSACSPISRTTPTRSPCSPCIRGTARSEQSLGGTDQHPWYRPPRNVNGKWQLCADTRGRWSAAMPQRHNDNPTSVADLGFFKRGGVTLGTRASEASEHWGGLDLRENEIWAFVSQDMIRNV